MLRFLAIISFSLVQSSCYKFYVYFRNLCYITFTQMSPVKRNEKITRENCGTQTRKKHFLTLYEMFIWGASFYSVFQFLNNFPDLPRFTSLVFSIGRWNLTAPFLDNIQGILNNYSLLKAGTYSLASNKLQSILYTFFSRVICTLIFVASIDCPSSPNSAGKITYYTIFSSRFG